MMYSRASESNTTNDTKEETTNGHTNALSHKKGTKIEIPRAHSPTKNKIPEPKRPETTTKKTPTKQR